jgi:hypothetical protein
VRPKHCASQSEPGVLAFYRVDYDPAITATRANLGAERFERVWAEGRDMTQDQAIAYAVAEPGEYERRAT